MSIGAGFSFGSLDAILNKDFNLSHFVCNKLNQLNRMFSSPDFSCKALITPTDTSFYLTQTPSISTSSFFKNSSRFIKTLLSPVDLKGNHSVVPSSNIVTTDEKSLSLSLAARLKHENVAFNPLKKLSSLSCNFPNSTSNFNKLIDSFNINLQRKPRSGCIQPNSNKFLVAVDDFDPAQSLVDVSITFLTPSMYYSGTNNEEMKKSFICSLLFTHFLGKGSSFLTGGPGNQQTSVLGKLISDQYSVLDNCSSSLVPLKLDVNGMYNDALAVKFSCSQSHVKEALRIISTKFLELSKNISNDDLERAKNLVLRSFFDSSKIDVMVREAIYVDKRPNHDQIRSLIESITRDDLKAFVNSILNQTPSLGICSRK
ncbi:hypothetical protein RCL1_002534 [Eukaryota sp. TZLM3-RCL]